ncbi:MAG: hypothetical protein ACE5I0_09880 [Candidatus Binatia bacterium]
MKRAFKKGLIIKPLRRDLPLLRGFCILDLDETKNEGVREFNRET